MGGGSLNPATTMVDWLWKAGGTAVANNAGSITSQVSANPVAGFSIVTYTGNGTAGATIGHGLGVAPKMVIVKARNAAIAGGAWPVCHTSLPASNTVYLDQTHAATTYLNRFDSTGFTSAVFKTGANGGAASELNTNGNTHVAYCFAEIAGYSKFGSYTGNGSADGPFVYCGFRPRLVMVKSSTEILDWWVYDSARDTYNSMNNLLRPNLSNVEATQGFPDFTANGFKIRNTGQNTSGQTYIFMAIAESPFGGYNSAGSNAR
jgi:hypothetical protein